MNINFFKATTDNYCGSYKIDKSLSLINIHAFVNYNKSYRIYVSGTDDYALSKNYKTKEECMTDVSEILNMKLVNIEDLKRIGFETDC